MSADKRRQSRDTWLTHAEKDDGERDPDNSDAVLYVSLRSSRPRLGPVLLTMMNPALPNENGAFLTAFLLRMSEHKVGYAYEQPRQMVATIITSQPCAEARCTRESDKLTSSEGIERGTGSEIDQTE